MFHTYYNNTIAHFSFFNPAPPRPARDSLYLCCTVLSHHEIEINLSPTSLHFACAPAAHASPRLATLDGRIPNLVNVSWPVGSTPAMADPAAAEPVRRAVGDGLWAG